ncbi:putative OsmC-like protein [Lactobacillus colini]|uniref:OsmC-like protein n=1 Tax=Lactobacillus colini TaxID=1819254 RepID=A0ABS4MB76_9LACO|nr:OsmC family protein [Lactobacillus colini]MBP2056893.1 putative OsmC-like protein [Lactobacillus colini]
MSEYIVDTNLEDPWKANNNTGSFNFLADEEVKFSEAQGPNPVQYLTGALNSCITISAGMINQVHKLGVTNFKVHSKAITKKVGHQSSVTKIETEISFDSEMDEKQREDYLSHILHVSTVYQTLKKCIDIEVKLQSN